jgi:Rieske Fe-S protein
MIHRRDVLIVGLASATGCAILRGGAKHPLYSAASQDGGLLRIPVAELQSVKQGTVLQIETRKPYPTVLLSYDDKNGWLAADAHCPHKGCVVDFDPAVSEWICPCHDSRFTPQGKLLDGPPGTSGLRTVPVRVDGEVVELNLTAG